jgi:DNA-binding IclR family transcriptional regulator
VIETELLEFISASIRSVWDLELLLCLWRSPERSWSPEDVLRELRASDSIVREGLHALQAAGLLIADTDGTYRYAPASRSFDDLVAKLDDLYRTRPNLVRKAVLLQHNKLQSFADAFRIKRD